MKVLFVFNHPAPYKVDLFNELSKSVDLTVCFERKANKDRNKDFYKKKILFNAIFIHGIRFGKENSLSSEVIKIIKNNKFDLIIMNGYHTMTEMKTIRYLKKSQIPYVLYINGGIIKKNESKLKKDLKIKYISGANYYFSPDERSNDYLIYYGADKNKIINYPYSTVFEKEILDKPLDKSEKDLLKQKIGIPYDKIAVSCGQFINRKNYLSLIKEWENIDKNYHLILIGGGPKKNEYIKYINENKLNNIHIFDFKKRDELFEYFRCADVFVFPSKEDIYAHVINEAFSQGLPVLCSDNVNAGLHLINNGFNGFIYQLGNNRDFETKLKEIFANEQMKNNAIKTAKNNTIEEMCNNHLKYFNEIGEKK
jgi:glycosyltransferase involved in cell wall biosynthesis